MPSQETHYIKNAVEHKRFNSDAAQTALVEWANINDSIVPKFVDRADWQQSQENMMRRRDDGKQDLILPKDLALWEMIDVIQVIDEDTFQHKPELKQAKSTELRAYGSKMKNAGVYLLQRLDAVPAASRAAALDVAEQFYQYGSRIAGQESESVTLTQAAQEPLSTDDQTATDRWLLGDKVYEHRMARLHTKYGAQIPPSILEQARQKALGAYFGPLVSESYRAQDPDKPWTTKQGPRERMKQSSFSHILAAIEKPSQQLNEAFSRRGTELLLQNMREASKTKGWRVIVKNVFELLGAQSPIEEKKLIDTLQIDRLREQLKQVRESGNPEQIAQLEIQIAQQVQQAITALPYAESVYNPSAMMARQELNCAGATILGGTIFDELGIKYAPVHLPMHATMLIVTSKDSVHWADMQNNDHNFEEVTELKPTEVTSIKELVSGKRQHPVKTYVGSKWNDRDLPEDRHGLELVALAAQPGLREIMYNALTLHLEQGLEEDAKDEDKMKQLLELNEERINNYPEYSKPYATRAFLLEKYGKDRPAVRMLEKAIALDPDDAYNYTSLAEVYMRLGQHEAAVKVLEEAVRLDPNYAYAHRCMGDAYEVVSKPKEALRHYERAVELEPDDSFDLHCLGKALYMAMQFDKAKVILTRYLELKKDPADPLARFAKDAIQIIDLRNQIQS